MSLAANLAVVVVALLLCIAIYAFTGGRVIFFFLPLLLAPLFLRRRP